MSKTNASHIIRYRRADVERLFNLCLGILRQISSGGFSYKLVESIIRTKRPSIILVQLVFENVLIRHLIIYSLQLNVNIDNIWRQLNNLLFDHSDHYDEYDRCTEFVTNCFQNAFQRHCHSKLSSSFVKTNVLDLTLFDIYKIFSKESYEHFYQSQLYLLSSLSLTTFPVDWLSRLNHLHLSENLIAYYSSDQFLHQTIHNYLIPNARDVIVTGLSTNVSRFNEKMKMINDILWESFVKNKASRLQLYRCDVNILYNLIRLFHNDTRRLGQNDIKPHLHDNHHCSNETEVYLYKNSSDLVHCIEEIVIDTSHISDFQKHKESSRIYNDLFRFLYNMRKITLKNCYIDNQSLRIYRSMAESFQLKYLSLENCIIQPHHSRIIINTNKPFDDVSFSTKPHLPNSKLTSQDNHLFLITPLTIFDDILWYLTVLRLRNVKVYERIQNRKILLNKNSIDLFFQSEFEKAKSMIFSIYPSKSTSSDKKNSTFTYHLTTDQMTPLSFYFEVPLVTILGEKEKLQQLMITNETFVSKKQTLSSSLAKANSKRRKINPLPVIYHEDTFSGTLSSNNSVLSSTTTIIHRAIYEHLRVLDLSGTQLETADYLRLVYIVEHAPFIEALDFSRWNKTIDFVPIINGLTIHCSHLKWINFEQTKLTQSSIISLISLFKRRSTTMTYINLKQTNLSISPNYLLTEFVHSLHECTLLEYLNLSKNSLSDQFLFSFLTEQYCQKVHHLHFFDIRQNTLITLDTIFQIVYRLYKHPIRTLLFCGLITTCNTNKEQRQVLMCQSNNITARSMSYQNN